MLSYAVAETPKARLQITHFVEACIAAQTNQTKPNQTKPNQTKPNQTKPRTQNKKEKYMKGVNGCDNGGEAVILSG